MEVAMRPRDRPATRDSRPGRTSTRRSTAADIRGCRVRRSGLASTSWARHPTRRRTSAPRGEGMANLFTCAIVAVNVDTGKMAWFYQTSPHYARLGLGRRRCSSTVCLADANARWR